MSRPVCRPPGTKTNPRRTAYRVDVGERVLGYVVDLRLECAGSVLPVPAARRWVPEYRPAPASITNAVRLEGVRTLGLAVEALERAAREPVVDLSDEGVAW